MLADVVGAEPANWVELRYRDEPGRFHAVPMLDDALSGDGAGGDGRYAATIPGAAPGARVEYVVVARATTSTARTFLPRRSEQEPFAQTSEVQSPATAQPAPSAQASQTPPQSMSVSFWFFTPSEQVGTEQACAAPRGSVPAAVRSAERDPAGGEAAAR